MTEMTKQTTIIEDNPEYYYIISATSENTLNVIQRIASIFSRNRVNIEQFNAYETQKKGLSHISIAIRATEGVLDRVFKQLNHIVELIDVDITTKIKLNDSVTE